MIKCKWAEYTKPEWTPPVEVQRRIVCAANLVNDYIVCGARHCDNVMNPLIKVIKEQGSTFVIQGFIDQYGWFYTREEAWIIAHAANQIIKRVGGDIINGGKLFSENLY